MTPIYTTKYGYGKTVQLFRKVDLGGEGSPSSFFFSASTAFGIRAVMWKVVSVFHSPPQVLGLRGQSLQSNDNCTRDLDILFLQVRLWQKKRPSVRKVARVRTLTASTTLEYVLQCGKWGESSFLVQPVVNFFVFANLVCFATLYLFRLSLHDIQFIRLFLRNSGLQSFGSNIPMLP